MEITSLLQDLTNRMRNLHQTLGLFIYLHKKMAFIDNVIFVKINSYMCTIMHWFIEINGFQ